MPYRSLSLFFILQNQFDLSEQKNRSKKSLHVLMVNQSKVKVSTEYVVRYKINDPNHARKKGEKKKHGIFTVPLHC